MDPVVRHLDLFSGIGGFALACRMVGGIETVAFCEIDPWARKVLAKHWPEIPIHEDVKKLEGTEHGTIDLITGGYPCQPFSLAGERKGEDDDRHLWPEVLRILKAARPRWLMCENVYGHISLGFDQVLSDLEAAGYAAGAVVVPACAVDARHRRDRLWLVANRKGVKDCGGGNDGDGWEHRQPSRESGRSDLGAGREAFRWPCEPGVGRVAHGISDRVDRLHGLGNAIVPQVAAEIIRAMMQADRQANMKCSVAESARHKLPRLV